MKYIIKVLAHASFSKMKKAIRAVHKTSGKSSIGIFFDMIWCAIRYGAGYYDYQVFGFCNLNGEQRKTYVTRVISKKLNMFMNDDEYAHFFDNKDEFYELFKDYIGRGFLRLDTSTNEEIKEFVSKREWLFCKLQDAECGKGCERVRVSDFDTFDDLMAYFKKKKFCTIEDCIINHPAINKLYPKAVDSLRIITVLDSKKVPHCIYIVQKLGYNNRVIDNNGLFAPVDIETGKIKYPFHSGDTTRGVVYTEHPDTHVKLLGYQIPFVKEAVDMCLKASVVVPQIRYIGWDVAITEKGPVIIEGNTYCAHDFWQLPPHTPNKIGMLPTIKKYIPEFKY